MGHQPVRSFVCTETPYLREPSPDQWEAGEGPTATENREVQVHTGRGLTAREVVAFAAARFAQDTSWVVSENPRCDLVVWEGEMIGSVACRAENGSSWLTVCLEGEAVP